MGPGTSVDVRTLGRAALRVAVVVAYVLLAVDGVVPWWFLALLLLRDFLLAATLPSLRSRGHHAYPVHLAGTLAVGVLAVGAAGLALGAVPGELGDAAAVVGWAAAGWGLLLSWYGGVVYLRQLAGVLADPRSAVGTAQ